MQCTLGGCSVILVEEFSNAQQANDLPVILLLLAVLAPVVVTAMQTPQGWIFGGFVFNPVDGNSYLAKMQQGYRGDWLFVLPYSAEKSQGVPLFLFYILLGHLGRVLQLPLIVMFHLARALGAVLLAFALRDFLNMVFSSPHQARISFWLALFGSGMGWLVAMTGLFTADFWVAEAYPFLSAYANPHFPLGMALALRIMIRFIQPGALRRDAFEVAGLNVLLAIVMPFGTVVVGVVCAVLCLWGLLTRDAQIPWRLAAGLVPGGLVLVYQYIITLRDPLLAGWNAQNLTITPPLWDVLVSFSPAVILALLAIPAVWRRREQPGVRAMLAWFALGALLMFVPFGLQRRFMFAWYIPVAAMAVLGLDAMQVRGRHMATIALVVLSLPTSLLIVAGGLNAASSNASQLRYTSDESAALAWIVENTPADALVVAAPETGLFIPARTGRRVIFGHPFETVNAEQIAPSWSVFSQARRAWPG